MRRQLNSDSTGAIPNGRSPGRSRATALAAAVALLITLAFAVPASASYMYTAQWGGSGFGDGQFDTRGGCIACTLTAAKSGTGQGTITSRPAGINCG
ncbi:MAG TPA: hypothetical protein VEV82_05180, partial [Actinomycetota bacterium]|nr:hypothetical protein [Actinomycetota bacterium]